MKFAKLLSALRARFRFRRCKKLTFTHGGNWRDAVNKHFAGMEKPCPGVYIIRNPRNKVVYISKGGTIKNDGKFVGQDVPGRLKNVRRSNVSPQRWSNDLAWRNGRKLAVGFLLIDPEELIVPAYVEACLLQAYREENESLPDENYHF